MFAGLCFSEADCARTRIKGIVEDIHLQLAARKTNRGIVSWLVGGGGTSGMPGCYSLQHLHLPSRKPLYLDHFSWKDQ